MKYIFMVAGKGTRLQPLTLNHPKSMYKLDEDTTLLQRMVKLINKHDTEADIVIVTGHMHRAIEEQVEGVRFVYNPFYEVTNSIASLWFAKDELDSNNVVLIDGDIVMADDLIREVMCKPVDRPCVLVDSSIKTDGDYNVEISGDQVLVMSKDLDNYYGEYAGVTKLDHDSALMMKAEMESMIEGGFYDQWYENALVQLIFKNDFKLYYIDISNYEWTEVDSVNDLLLAKRIHTQEKMNVHALKE